MGKNLSSFLVIWEYKTDRGVGTDVLPSMMVDATKLLRGRCGNIHSTRLFDCKVKVRVNNSAARFFIVTKKSNFIKKSIDNFGFKQH